MDPSRPRNYSPRPGTALCLTAALLLSAAAAPADDARNEFLLFPSIDTFNDFDLSNPEVDDDWVRPSLNVLYSHSGKHFRVLGEYLWSSTESELERIKLGWQLGDNTMLWFGRFHTTSKFWTTEYHHGQFMQTPITRPSLEEWEDESGPIASHLTGVSLEHEVHRDDESVFNVDVSVGLAPRFVDDELSPFDVLDPESGHDWAVSARLAYKPSIFADDQLGILAGWHDINVDSSSNPALVDLGQIEQTTVGVFGSWSWGKWRALGSFTYFYNQLHFVDSNVEDEFVSGYLQLERRVARDWTVFGRTDNGFGEDNSMYLRLLPAFIAHRHMLGVRWDFHKQQSLTLEIADTSTQGDGADHNSFKEFRLQWSAVLP